MYVVQRTELLAACFYLLTLLFFVLATRSVRSTALLAASVAACALGMLSKEIVVSAPIAVWLYDAVFVSGSFGAALRKRRAYYAGLAGTWLILASLLTRTGGTIEGTGLDLELGLTPWEYLLTQSRVVLHYLRLAVWPHPLRLYYDWPAIRTLGEAWPYLLVIVPLAGATAWAVMKRRPAGFAGALFFMVLAPSSSIVPVPTELVGERRMYLPLAAVVALLTSMVLVLLRRAGLAGRAVVPAALTTLIAAILGVTTVSRVRDYRTEESIWRDTAAKAPRSALVRNNLGRALAAQGRVDEAIAEYREGLRIDPRHARHPQQAGQRAGRPGPLRGGGNGVRDRAAGGPGGSQDPQQLRARAVEAGAGRGGSAAPGDGRAAAAGLRARALQPGERPHPAGRVPQAIPHLEAVIALPDEDAGLRARAARDLDAARSATPAR